MGDATEQDVAFSYNFLVVDSLRKMCDARADNNWSRYFSFFEFAFRLLVPHIPIEERVKIEANYHAMQAKIVEIEALSSAAENDESKKIKIIALRRDFADAHLYYLDLGLSKIGVIKIADDGIINLTDESLGSMKAIVRMSGGIRSSAKQVLARGEETDVKV